MVRWHSVQDEEEWAQEGASRECTTHVVAEVAHREAKGFNRDGHGRQVGLGP